MATKTAKFGQYTYKVDSKGLPYGSPLSTTAKKTTSSGGGSSSAKVVSGGSNPNNLTTQQVKEIQEKAGIKVDGIIGPQTQAVLNKQTTPTPTPKTTTTPVSSANLKVGAKGTEVTNLQNFLISQGYNVGSTGADGIYGANTDAAVKAYQKSKGLTADGIVGVNTAAKMNNVLPTAPLATDPALTDPAITPPVLPKTDTLTQDSYMESLNKQIAQMQQTIDNQRQDYLTQIQQDKQQAQQELEDLRNRQGDIINEQGATAIAAKEQKQIEIQKEIARFDEAYKVKQGLTTQLQDLITQGNALITSQKATTGLTAIRNPRVNETISNLESAAAVLKIGIDAQDNNMVNVQSQLNTAVSAITSAYKDQLDYYQTLNNFYESTATDAGNKLINLTAAEKDFINTTISTLQNKIDTVQANADKMQELFLDPSTATAFAKAGITLNTPQSEWGTKLEKQAYADELSTQSKEMAGSGYTPLLAGSAPSGAEVVKITDSKGVTKTYWKKGDGTGSLGITPDTLLQSAIDSGMSAEDAALDVSGYYDSTGVSIDNKTLNSWIAKARTMKPSSNNNVVETPVPTTTKTPVTAKEAGQATAPLIKGSVNPTNSPVGIIGPKEMVDIAKGISEFFKGVTGL